MLLLDNNVRINSNVLLYRTVCTPMLASITRIVQYAQHIHYVMLHTFLMFLGNITINLIPNVFALLKLFSALVWHILRIFLDIFISLIAKQTNIYQNTNIGVFNQSILSDRYPININCVVYNPYTHFMWS